MIPADMLAETAAAVRAHRADALAGSLASYQPAPVRVDDYKAYRLRHALGQAHKRAAVQVDEWARSGDSWFVPSVTDHSEAIHRIDMEHGKFYCSCLGFETHRHCKHCDRALLEVLTGFAESGGRSVIEVLLALSIQQAEIES